MWSRLVAVSTYSEPAAAKAAPTVGGSRCEERWRTAKARGRRPKGCAGEAAHAGAGWLVGLAVDREETRLAHEGERADRDGAHVPGDAALEGGGQLLRRRAFRPQAEEGEDKDRIDGDGGAGGEAQRRDVSQ